MKNIRIPARIQVRELDNITGSYPLNSHAGDQERKNMFSVKFDDTKTVVFRDNVSISAPTCVSADSVLSYLSSSLFTTGTIRKGLADEFVSFNNSGEQLKPFNDSKIGHVNRDDIFYATGSLIEDVGFGFESSLLSKTIIQIDLNPSTTYSASIQNGQTSDGTNPITDVTTDVSGGLLYADRAFVGTANYPMMYYNFDIRKWEGIGRGIPTNITGGMNSTALSSSAMQELSVKFNLDEQTYGFGPSYGFDASSFGQNAALPMSAFGFPVHPKFHATSSQLFHLSGVLDRPFILEKITYEFSGSYSTGSLESSRDRFSTLSSSFSGDAATGNCGAPISTFFILNQRGPTGFNTTISPTVRQDGRSETSLVPDILSPHTGVDPTTQSPWRHVLTASIPTSIQLSRSGSETQVNTIRDLVTFAQISSLGESFTDTNRVLLERDLNIVGLQDQQGVTLWSGKYILSSSVKTSPYQTFALPIYMGINDTATLKFLANPGFGHFGGRSLIENSGRDYNGRVVGNELTSSIVLSDSQNNFTVTIKPDSRGSYNSPYILQPTDKLVFGWQVPLGSKMYSEGQGTARLGWSSALSIAPGAGKLTFYGSFIRNASEYHRTLNQNLTTDSIHETFGSDDISDQFQTDSKIMYSGSSIINYITGSMSTSLASRRLLSTALHTGSVDNLFGLTLSTGAENRARLLGFNRNYTLVSQNERFYDTLMPRIDKIVRINGSAVYYHGDYNHVVLGCDSYFANSITGVYAPISELGDLYSNIVPDATWDRSFPFEPKYSAVERNVDVISNTEATRNILTLGTALANPVYRKLTVARVMNRTESVNPLFPVWYLFDPAGEDPNGVFPSDPRNILLHLYGVGMRESGTMTNVTHWGSRSFIDNEIVNNSIFRGFKYGILNALPEFSKSVFQSTRYGQLRDMLEQRLDSKFYDTIGIGSDGEQNGLVGVTTSPVQIMFVEPRTNNITDAMRTFSSNLSSEATSSMPYFDDIVKNRADPIDLTLINTASN